MPLQQSLANEPTLVAVSDVFAEKAETIRQRYGAERAYTDYQEMIEKEKPDIVCIATRPGPHADMTVFASENGVKGIYCEKPLCCSMEEGGHHSGRCSEARCQIQLRHAASLHADLSKSA